MITKLPVQRVSVFVAVVGLLIGAWAGTAGASRKHASKTVLTVAYSADYVFLLPSLATKWWHSVGTQFEKQYPNVTVKYEPIAGGYNDFNSKLALLYRTPSTSPDIAELPSALMGEWVSSDDLLALNNYVKDASWWAEFPQSVKNETTVNGKVYAVNHGENTTALYYNIPMFKKAGIKVPWQPKNWQQIYAAAAKIHKVLPQVTAFFVGGGTAPGIGAIQYNGGNILAASSNPTIYDQKTHKWVVDSPGILDTLNFYKKLAVNGWQGPESELLSSNLVGNAPGDYAKNNIAIGIGVNYYAQAWIKSVCGPCWVPGAKIMGVAKIPTINGQNTSAGAPYASLLGCWDLAIGADTKHAKLAWDFINIAQDETNALSAARGAGFVPPAKSDWSAPAFDNQAPPFNYFFSTLLPISTLAPETSDYSVWATGFEEATGAIISNPRISVQSALNTMKSYITGQLGASLVETIK